METFDKIRDCEINFPRLFADVETRDYGLLFYNTSNPVSHDSNHAVIFQNGNYNEILKDIKRFYLAKNLCPRIYPSLIDGQYQALKPYLEEEGYTVDIHDARHYLIHTQACAINTPSTLEIKRLHELDEKVIANVYEPEDAELSRIVLTESLKSEQYHLFAGYLHGIPVATASIAFSSEGVARIDSVETGIPYRGNGYARQLVRYFIEYHYQHSNNLLYLNSENPTAIKIYREGGFVMYEKFFESWTAYIRE